MTDTADNVYDLNIIMTAFANPAFLKEKDRPADNTAGTKENRRTLTTGNSMVSVHVL
ncbi:hypothetical protein ACFL6P_00770 [Candidatus Latescibacterota bacterium]